MAHVLNFRDFKQPTLTLNMNDEAGTTITVTSPTVALTERLEANLDNITAVFNKGDTESVDATWELAAELISCNREHIKVTAAELKGRYGMSYEMLMAFIIAYTEFIGEIEKAKN